MAQRDGKQTHKCHINICMGWLCRGLVRVLDRLYIFSHQQRSGQVAMIQIKEMYNSNHLIKKSHSSACANSLSLVYIVNVDKGCATSWTTGGLGVAEEGWQVRVIVCLYIYMAKGNAGLRRCGHCVVAE